MYGWVRAGLGKIMMCSVKQSARVFALDLGSKNFKLVSGEIVNGALQVRLEDKRTLWLGDAVEANNGRISKAKLAEIEQALHELTTLCGSDDSISILAIGTGALRVAANADQVVAIAAELGIKLEIASGLREGQVAYLAATGGQPHQLVSDLGSQSLQLSFSDGTTIHALSRPLGYRALYDRYLKSANSFIEAEQTLRDLFSRELASAPRNPQRLVAVSANTAAAWAAGSSKQAVSGKPLPRVVLATKLAHLRSLSPAELRQLQATDLNWQKILPGVILIDHLLEHCGQTSVLLAEVELPIGLIVEHFGKSASLRYTARPPGWN